MENDSKYESSLSLDITDEGGETVGCDYEELLQFVNGKSSGLVFTPRSNSASRVWKGSVNFCPAG